MDVTVSFFGRFWSFNLANQLNKRNCLRSLVTSYPAYEAERFGVPKNRIHSLPHYEALQRILGRFKGWIPKLDNLEPWIKRGFEKAAASHISKKDDIFVGLSGVSERGIERAGKIGVTSILERGSSHVEYQKGLLKEEGEAVGVSVDMPSKKYIEKEKREYEKSDLIFVPSSFAKESFLEHGFKESKVCNAPFGVDTEEFSPIEKKDDVFRVVFAGQMMLRKGVHYLLKAFSDLDLPNSELWLLGKKRPEIAPFFDKYEGGFQHLGHKPQDELYRYYSQGSVFVLNSIEDGFGMVIPQAMACGLPAICTQNTGGPDIVRDGTDGFIIPIRDTESLKEKILWCYENQDECRTMGHAARRRVEEDFTWHDYGRRVVNSYRSVLDSD